MKKSWICFVIVVLSCLVSTNKVAHAQGSGTFFCTNTNTWLTNGSACGTADLTSPGPIGGTTPAAGTFTNITSAAAGALSAPVVSLTGLPVNAGGTGTTTVPFIYANNGAAAPTTWSTNGTFFGINAPLGFTGNCLDFHVNGGVSIFKATCAGSLSTNGAISTAGTTAFFWSSRSQMFSPIDSVIEFTNIAATSFTRLDFGGTTSSFPALQFNGTTIQSELADGSAQAPMSASLFKTETNCSSSGAPAVCSTATSGSVVVAAAATTVVVNTTNVTANSQILLTEDSSLGTKLGVTCNTTTGRTYSVSARTAATSFTITSSAAPAATPACLSYLVFN